MAPKWSPMPNPDAPTSALARAFGQPVSAGLIRQAAEDFKVTEQLGFEPSGDGEHDFLYIEKVGANTQWVAGHLARHAGVSLKDVGYAGLKDRHAVTRQWFSVRRPSGAGTDWAALELDGVDVLETRRNERKLRRGAHTANEFRIRVRNLDGNADAIEQRLAEIRTRGVPNYFGEQRFGRDGNNLRLAQSLFDGRRMKRDKRGIALSAARSQLFNIALSCRVADGSWEQILPPEAVNLDGSGSIFTISDISPDIQKRLAVLDIHPTCVMWGRSANGEDAVLSEYDKSAAKRFPALALGLEGAGLSAARRATRLNVRNLDWHIQSDVLQLCFTLARGGYATAVLREVTG